MIVGSCALRLRLPGVRSLKSKRAIISRLKSRLRANFNVAVAEVELQDAWQAAVLGVATVGSEAGYVNGLLDRLVLQVERETDIELLGVDLSID